MNRSYSKKRHIELVNEALERAYVEKNNNKKLLNEGNINLAMDTIEGYILGANLLVYPSEMRAVFNGLSDCQVKDLADKWLKKHGESLYTSLKDEWGGSSSYSPQIDRLVNLDKGYNHGYGGGCSEAKKASDDKYKTFTDAIANLGTFAGTTWKKENAASHGYVYAGNMVIREKKISYLSDGVWQSANVESGSWGDPSTVKLEGGMSAEDFINKHKNWGTKKDNEGGGGGRPRTTWEECSGTYHKGCKSSNGVIAKVQGCLGISTDGKFGSGTQSAIKTKIGTTTFTDADVDKLCKKEGETSIGGGGSPTTGEETPKENPINFS